MSDLEPLDCYVVVVKPDGRQYRWDGGYRAADTPTNLTFGSKRNTGFDTMSVTLSRQLTDSSPDLELFDDIYVKATSSGASRWEGRVVQINRSSGPDGSSIQVDAVGWMAHMQDQKQPMFYVNQDLSRWTGPSQGRQAAILTGGLAPAGPGVDDAVGTPALKLEATGSWATAGRPLIEGYLDAGVGNSIASIYYAWTRGTYISAADVNWQWDVSLSTDQLLASADTTASLRATGPGTGTLTATTTTRRYAKVLLLYAVAVAGNDGQSYQLYWTCLAAYSNNGLTKQGTATSTIGQGYYASDVLRHMVSNYCPRLKTDGIEDTFLAIPHLDWQDPTTVYDAALKLNGYHVWELNVWEDHTVYFAPLDLSGEWDWEVRTDDPGIEINLQGDSAADLVNGAIVHYDQLPGREQVTLYPRDDPALRNDDDTLAVNRHHLGYRPVEVTPSFPMTREVAISVGAIALAEAQQAKRPGTITVSGGYIRDRAGRLQPASKVRSGDRVRITDIPGDVIRPIGEAAWDQEALKLTIGVDNSIERMEAFFNRVDVNLQAQNLAA